MVLEWWLCVPARCGEDVRRLCKAVPSWEYNLSVSLSLPSPQSAAFSASGLQRGPREPLSHKQSVVKGDL